MSTLKAVAGWAGIGVTGACGVVLLGGGKIWSGTLLIATTFLMVLPVWRRVPRWARLALLVAVVALVVANISTTQLPGPSTGMVTRCGDEEAATFTPTGIRFLDQLRYILGSFLTQAAPS
ncbi:hypothetical protein ACQP60_05820 [Isoptericola variabilis]|uniref:hypothetical protein n=1 Tax=Isoptericola variabilis TaxID=139208 RepID=UPI003D1EC2FE